MKVYVVNYVIDYEGDFLRAIFSSMEKAEEYISLNKQEGSYGNLEIEEYELDVVYD